MEKVLLLITLFCCGFCLPFAGKVFPNQNLYKAFEIVSRQRSVDNPDFISVTVMLFIFADSNYDSLLSSNEIVNFLVNYGNKSRKDADNIVQLMLNVGDKDGDGQFNSKETLYIVSLIFSSK